MLRATQRTFTHPVGVIVTPSAFKRVIVRLQAMMRDGSIPLRQHVRYTLAIKP